MKKKEWKAVLETQLDKSYQSTKASVQDEEQDRDADSEIAESAKTLAQPESSKAAAQQEPSKPRPHRSSCASPGYSALFVPWPYVAPSRGQSSMPPFILSLINELPTKEERIKAKQLWNRSLPISANVGIIEYNRVDGVMFEKKVGEKYGEGWWRRLEDLATGLNDAADVIKGKCKEPDGKALGEGSREGEEREMKRVELPKGEGKEPEMQYPTATKKSAKESKTKTLDHLLTTSALGENDEGSKTEAAKPTTGEGKEPQSQTNDEAASAAIHLLSPSSTLSDNPLKDPSALFAFNPLSALWYVIDRFFSSGPPAASYFFVALEAAIRLDSTVVHALHIPAPPAFWTEAADWKVPKTGMTLLLTLASSPNNAFDAFAHHSKSLGRPGLRVEAMRKKAPASLRKAVIRAKADAASKQRTTILGVSLRDVLYSQLCEVHGKGIEGHFATFARMFVLGVCAEGAKLWLVGGEWGETATVWESNDKVGAAVGTWEEMDEFVRDFEGCAVPNGTWNTKRFKWFRRCFGVDLKQFDLQIDAWEKEKRGVPAKEKDSGAKRLLNEIEAWVEIYKIEDVTREDVGKFRWL